MTTREPSDRELEALAGKMKFERTHAVGLLVASGIFIALGVYGLVFSALYDPGLVPLVALSLVSIAAGLGALFGRRFALWLALLLFPVGIVEALATLQYSVIISGWYSSVNYSTTVFNVSLIMYMVGLILSLLLVVDKRSELK